MIDIFYILHILEYISYSIIAKKAPLPTYHIQYVISILQIVRFKQNLLHDFAKHITQLFEERTRQEKAPDGIVVCREI